MTEEDWIILRLLKGWIDQIPTRATLHPDYVRTVQYLRHKVGDKNLNEAIDRLNLSLK